MSFSSLETERLLLRAVEPGDVDALQERRGHPEVNEFLIWDSPYPRERAEGLVSEVLEMDGPANDRWWMLTIVEKASGAIIADLAFFMSWEMRTAEIGYTMHPDFWGNGFVTEAVQESIRWLFEDVGVTRILAKIHPDNRASARVLERSGFVFEGHTKESYWKGGVSSDDWIYGMTRPLWAAWQTRAHHSVSTVELQLIDRTNIGAVLDLQPHASQRRFTDSTSRLIASGLVRDADGGGSHAQWMRAIVDGDMTRGFIGFEQLTSEPADMTLTGFMIDRLSQRRGIGTKAFGLAAEQLKGEGARTIKATWELASGSPDPFFVGLGFEVTRREADDRAGALYRIS